MERGFLSQKGSGGGRGVKEKNLNRNKKNTSSGICVFTILDDTMNDDTPISVASTVQEGVTPSVVDMTVETDKQNSLEDNNVLGSFPSLSTPGTTPTGNAPGKSSYANITGKPSGKKVNVRTLFTPGGNGIDVVIPVDSIRALVNDLLIQLMGFSWERRWHTLLLLTISNDGLDVMLENDPWFIRNNPLILKKWHPDENRLKEDVSIVPVWVKLHGVPVTAFSEDGSSYVRVMIELQADVEFKDKIVVAMPKITKEGHYTCAGEKKTVKKPSQTFRGVPVGPKIGFKPQKEYRPVPKKPNASSSGNKKKGVELTIEVSNSNPFDVLNSVDNNTKFGKLRLLDNNENRLFPTGIVESDSEVVVIFDETANLRISTSSKDGSDKGYGTNSLLKQWRDSYPDNDDYDAYNDDMYENHDLSEHLRSICVDINITVRGRKKK
uniref:Uncharacterized protein n=1 Tax=Tanacetum cinerariifolium TaxID=118510 RepID=A0A699H5U8_TANCI|nr:hypothetical protein [Tanacetum cinerariifolium]